MARAVFKETPRARMHLSLHRFLMRLCAATVAAFLWIFIFEYFAILTTIGHALISTVLLYALCQTTTILLTPFALKRLRGGMRRALVYGVLLHLAALVFLGVLLLGIFPHGLVAIALLLGAHRAFYRVPYAVEYAALGRPRTLDLFWEIILALAPLAGGIFISASALPAQLFFAAALLSAFSLLPIFSIPNVHETFAWGYRETFAHLAAPENRRVLLSSVRQGIQGAALFLVWPFVLLFVFGGSPVGIGAAFSATLLIVLLFRASRRRVVVEEHADGGTFMDEYTALKEMGLALGRLVLAFALVLALTLLQ